MVAKTSFRLVFDRFLLPTSTFRQSICLRPVLGLVTAAKDCANGVLLEPAYDPVLLRIVYRQQATSPGLASGTRYTFSVFPTPGDGTTNGIEAFDGAPLAKAVSRDFTTRGVEPEDSQVEPPPSGDHCFDVIHDVFHEKCATGGCHTGAGDPDHGLLLGAAEGLDLSSKTKINATALSDVAHGTQTGEHADQGEVSPSRFGRAMPIIDPGWPGNSYLLYKLLVNSGNGAPGANAADEQKRLDELDRLRAAIIVGMPMPPRNGKGVQVDPDQLAKISEWILAGAPTAACP